MSLPPFVHGHVSVLKRKLESGTVLREAANFVRSIAHRIEKIRLGLLIVRVFDCMFHCFAGVIKK